MYRRHSKGGRDATRGIALLAGLLGHSSIETTRIYLQQSSSEQEKMVNRIVDW